MIEVNYLVVLVAAIVSMAVGFVWYMFLFGKPWSKLMGKTRESMEKEKANIGKSYSISFMLSLVAAYILYHVMVMSEAYFGNPMVMTGLMTAFWSWLGFIMPTQATDVLFGGKKSWKLFYINTGYQLAALLAMGATIGLMS
ncbi:MAG TPA: DUF1761 domain-containing protein [Candidatus Limnocylindrales bacterium]|nr:DUF1761 domain-containing protein [Candidatus Limnocylindrales bacterium]